MCERSGIQIWLLDGSNVSYSYFIRESGKVRVSTLAWEEPVLEADQDTHLQTLLQSVCVGGEWEKEWVLVCLRMHACMYKTKCVHRSGNRNGKECKQETESSWKGEREGCTDLKIDLYGKSLLCSIPCGVCVHARACSSLSKILKPKWSSTILLLKSSFFIHHSSLTSVKTSGWLFHRQLF